MDALKIKVFGKVQGVGYRASVQTKAIELNVIGLVYNEPDGSVYVEAVAERKQLDEFVLWCGKGPKGALVNNIILEELNVKKYNGFNIVR